MTAEVRPRIPARNKPPVKPPQKMQSKAQAKPPAKVSPLRLPREHGATVAFVLSSILSLSYGGISNEVVVAVASMALIMVSIHRPSQAIASGIVGAAVLALGYHQLLMAGIVLLMALGLKLFEDYSSNLDAGLKQTCGMAAVSLLPVLAGAALKGLTATAVIHAAVFTGAALLGTAIVQLVINSRKVTPVWSLVASALLLLPVVQVNAPLVGWTVLPYTLQIIWLARLGKPSFKDLGIMEAVCLAWTTALLFAY